MFTIALQFIRERIDLEALMLLGEADLGDLGMQMGPRKKLLKAVAERRSVVNPSNPPLILAIFTMHH